MKIILEKIHRNLVRFIANAPKLNRICVSDLVDITATEDRCVLVLKGCDENPSQTNEPIATPELKQALFKSAKTPKQIFYRKLLLENADEPGFAFRSDSENIVFRSLAVDKDEIIRYHEIMESSISANIVPITSNELCIGHRPKKDDLLDLRDEGFTHIVTVLGKSEGALDVGQAAEKAGFQWIWLPLANAKVPLQNHDDGINVRRTIRELKSLFLDGNSFSRVYLHCSAGFHRTGMISLLLLRQLGFDEEDAMDFLEQLREATVQNVGRQRIQWAFSF